MLTSRIYGLKFGLFLVIIFSYFKVLSANSLVNPDAHIIYTYLESLDKISNYFLDLIHFQTIDFQPIRDLTLYFDLFIYKHFHINISIIQNAVLWFVACSLIDKILIIIFPNLSKKNRHLSILLFATYPLFSTTISWGIARKHLLSFVFILLATKEFIQKGEDKKSLIKSSIFYLLSVFSQPINLLWPVWAILYGFKNKKEKIKKLFFQLSPIFILGFILNYLYYERSKVFRIFYHSKTEQIGLITDQMLAIGHYTVQLIFPSKLSYIYPLGWSYQFAGISITVLLIYLLFKLIKDKLFFVTWLVFGVLPLVIILNTPNLLMDSYLLVPGFSLFMLLVHIFHNSTLEFKKFHILAAFMIAGFIIVNTNNSDNWLSKYQFTKDYFEKYSSCSSAIPASVVQYDKNGYIEKELKKFMEERNCIKIYSNMTYSQVDTLVRLNSQILFFENGVDFQDRVKSLKNMSARSKVSLSFLAALYARENKKEELLKTLSLIFNQEAKRHSGFEIMLSKFVYPYCKKENLKDCLSKIQPVIVKKDKIWIY